MAKVKVLSVQIQPEIGNKTANYEKVLKIVNEYSWFKPDLVVLPEVFNSGLVFNPVEKIAESIPNGQTALFLSDLAEKFNTNVVGGSFLEKCPEEEIRNTSVVFDRNGKVVCKYSKMHLFPHFGSREAECVTAGCEVKTVDLDFGRVGLTICYDLRFPELYRKLMESETQIAICIAAWPQARIDHWRTLIKARAIENQFFMVAVNQVGKSVGSLINAGNSMIINPWGDEIASAGGTEGAMIAEIDTDLVNATRESFPVLKDRRKNIY